MRDNKGRVLTLRIMIEDPEAAKWIWAGHLTPVHGVSVRAIAEGDLFRERDVFENRWNEYVGAAPYDDVEEIEAKYPMPNEESKDGN